MRGPLWTPEEDAILKAAANSTEGHEALTAAGYHRPISSTRSRYYKLRFQGAAMDGLVYWPWYLPTYPKATREALSALAERAAREGMTITQYEREQARILGGSGA